MFAEIQNIHEITQLADIRKKLITASAEIDTILPAFSGIDSGAPANFNVGHNLYINKYQTSTTTSLDLSGLYIAPEILAAAKVTIREKQSAVESRLLVLGVQSIPTIIPLSIKDTYHKDASQYAFVVPTSGGNGGTILYTSDNEFVAEVDNLSGVVRVKAAGTAIITATEEGTTNTTTTTIIVYDALTVAPTVHYFMDSTVDNSYFTGGSGTYSFTSSDPLVATVNSTTGEITMVGNGETTIQITDPQTEYTRDYVLTIVDHMTLTTDTIMVTTQTYLPTVTGGSGTFEYSTSAPEIMEVNQISGQMIPIAAGAVTLSAVDLYTNEIKTSDINVYKLSVEANIGLTVGDTYQIVPVGGTGNYIYESSDVGVASLLGGLITAVSIGSVTITVTDATSGEVKTITVNVE